MQRPAKTEPAPKTAEPADAAANELAEERRVREAIFDALLSHRLPPGTRLVETPLCEAFGVTRSLLRRVFVRLANEKVIDLQHNRGHTVPAAVIEDRLAAEIAEFRRSEERRVGKECCR